MKLRYISAIGGMVLAAAGTLSALPAAAQDLQTPAIAAAHPGVGDHLTGRAEAGLRLVEYVSYTCPHCARFEQDAGDILKLAYVSGGRVSVRIRNLVRDPVDLAAALLANCGKDSRFAANHAAIMRSHTEWMGRLRQTTAAQRARYSAGSSAARRQAIARDAGLYALMKKRGYDATRLDRCLADEDTARALAENSAGYAAAGINGTPSFTLNGTVLVATHDWDTLRAQLDARLGR